MSGREAGTNGHKGVGDAPGRAQVVKRVFCILNVIFLSILLICAAVSGVLVRLSGGSANDLLTRNSFVDSDAYEKRVTRELTTLSGYIDIWATFDTEGTFNNDKLLDVFRYRYHKTGATSEAEGLYYRIGDLLSWSKQEGIDQFWEEHKPTLQSLSEEKLQSMIGEGTPEELYTPEGYSSVEAYAQQNSISEELCLRSINEVLYLLAQDYLLYQSSIPMYKLARTNLRYYAVNGASYQKYGNNESGSNLSAKTGYRYMSIGDNEIWSTVDLSFTAQDALLEAKEGYDDALALVTPLIICFFVMLAGCVVSFLFVVQQDKKNTARAETFLDRIYLDIFLLLWAGLLCGTGYGIAFCVAHESGNLQNGYTVVIALLSVLLAVLLYLGFLTLNRKLRRGGITAQLAFLRAKSFVREGFFHIQPEVRQILLFSCYIGLSAWLLSLKKMPGYLLLGLLQLFFLILLVRSAVSQRKILTGMRRITAGELDYKLDTTKIYGDEREMAETMNQVGDVLQNAVTASLKNERLRTDLITNVSHDIKTPLTSIINYVDLLKRENIQDEKVKGYLEVLDKKSQRLKNLTEDLVEATKITSGNIRLDMICLDFKELLMQTIGEFAERFRGRELELVVQKLASPLWIQADGKRLWRVLENLFSNVVKYAMPHTRVYVDTCRQGDNLVCSIKNTSENPLNIPAEELTERFIRGDVSRSSEGSGLGLSIAQNLTRLMGGTFSLYLDGDLFKATITFQLSDPPAAVPLPDKEDEHDGSL